jgi:hypothetical protein
MKAASQEAVFLSFVSVKTIFNDIFIFKSVVERIPLPYRILKIKQNYNIFIENNKKKTPKCLFNIVALSVTV